MIRKAAKLWNVERFNLASVQKDVGDTEIQKIMTLAQSGNRGA